MHEADGPERPIRSLREFLFHMFTVMLGLLLALGLEAIVEWRHHVHLAHQATENIRRELADNERWLDATLDFAPGEKAHLAAWLAETRKVKAGAKENLVPPPLPQGWTFNVLARANYEMAHSNNALSFMPFEQASGFASAYTVQDELVATQHDAWNALARFGSCFVGLDENQSRHLTVDDAACIESAARALVVQIEMVEGSARTTKKAYAEARGSAPAGHR